MNAYLMDCINKRKPPKPGMFENLHFHDLKRRALTDAYEQNLDAQGLGGHSRASMTERNYLNADKGDAHTKPIIPPTIPALG
jgi:hypothetical protein